MKTLKYTYFFIISLLLLVSVTCNIEKKIKSDLRRISSELKVKKALKNNLLTLSYKSKLPSLPKCTSSTLKSKIAKSKLKSKIKKHCLPKIKPPKLLGIPTLPLIPPLLPPILPKLLPVFPLLPPIPLIPPLLLLPPLPIPPPLLPLPMLPPPLLPTAPKILNTIRLKKIKNKCSLQKALGSEIKPVAVPLEGKKNKMLGKLIKLKTDGSLTRDEYLRFKKLLRL